MVLLVRAAAIALTSAIFGAGGASAEPEEPVLEDGAYEVRLRLELPNVEAWAASTTRTICLPPAGGTNVAPFPVLSGNNPFDGCPARNVRRSATTVRFEIVCEGRDGASARALYKLTPRAFRGRIAMMMGGKNMTMTEVQSGHRIGECAASGGRAHRPE